MTWGKSIKVTFYFWAILLIVLVLAAVSHAEWMQVGRLGGLVTRTELGVGPMENARLVDGWQVRAGGLHHPWYTKHRCAPIVNTPTYLLGHSATGNSLLFYTDNFYRLRNDTCALVGMRTSTRPDSGQAVNGTDSILSQFEHIAFPCVDSAGRYWLNYALTDRPSVTWDGASVPVDNFYSNRWLKATTALTVQTEPMSNPLSAPSIGEGSGTVDYDTTLIFDGTYIWKYEGYLDSIRNVNTTTITPPAVYQNDVSPTTHYYDTLRVKNVWEAGAGDTVLVMVIDPDDSLYTGTADSTDGPTKYWILWDDTLSTSSAKPCSILYAVEYSTDSMVIYLAADSSLFAGVNHYWGTGCMYAILYRPGARTDVTPVDWFIQDTASGSPRCWPVSYVSSLPPQLKVASLGHFGLLHYAQVEIVAGTVHLPFTSALMAKKARVTDCDVFQIVANGNGAANPDTLNLVCTGYSANTKQGHGVASCTPSGTAWPHYFTFLAFSKDTIKMSDFIASVSATAYNRPRFQEYNVVSNPDGWNVLTVSATTSNDRFAVLGKQRCWTSGNTHLSSTRGTRDSSLWVRYSNIMGTTPSGGAGGGDYATFPSANKLLFQGFDPVTGLSVSDQTVRAYMARSINLITGFTSSNFATQKAVEGQGAVNHWVIAPTVQSGADALCNDNGAFLFSGGGLTPLSDNIVEVFTDSINWDAGAKLRGAVWDNMYFVTAPFDTFSSCQSIIGFDLETGDAWLSRSPAVASVWNFKAIDGSEELYYGDRDSSVIWQEDGATSDLYYVSDWRSMWNDLGDGSRVKGVQSYRVDYNAGSAGDTLIVDWYVDFIGDSAVWSDTLVAAEAGYQSDPSSVPMRVAGRYLSFGFRSADSAMNPVGFGFEYNDRGKGRR